jgi:hypothetical protein
MTVTPDRMTFVLELMGLLTIALAVIAICGTVVAVIVFRKADHSAARIFGQLMNRAGMLQMLTVATIVQTVLVLRIFDGLSADATISVLSGIAGYVLGGLTKPQEVGREQERRAV